MLNKVMIDFKGIEQFKNDLDKREYMLLPYIYLFADQILEPVICDQPMFPEVEFPEFVNPVYIFNNNPPFLCDYAITTLKIGIDEYMGSYFSPVKQFKKRILLEQGLTAYNSVLLLAAAGLELQLPALTFDITRSEEIEEIRNKYSAERLDYVDSIKNIAYETYDRLKTESYLDTVNWALDNAYLKIEPKIRSFENAIRGVNRKLAKRLSINFVKDELPAIGNALLEKPIIEGGRQVIVSVLKTLCSNLFQKHEERKYPEVLYGYKIRSSLKLK